jgi:hypothetical protein
MKISQPPSALFARRTTLFFGMIGIFLVVGSIAILNEHGYFHTWLNLGNPLEFPQPGEKVIKILAATPRSIRVATNRSHAFETDLPWIAWRKDPKGYPWHWHEAPYEEDYTPANFGCPYSFWVPPLLPGLFVRSMDQIEVKGCRMFIGIEQANYIILEDGTVWVWESQKYTRK